MKTKNGKNNKRSLNVFLACKEALWSEKEQRKGMSKGNKGRELTHGSLRSLTYFFGLFPQCEAHRLRLSYMQHKNHVLCSFAAATVVCGMSQKRRLKSANVEKSVKETRRSGVGALITPLSTTHVSLNIKITRDIY